MRFTKKGTGIDLDKAEREILHAIDRGVNYFDTAYIYPGSEAALGEILARNQCRDKVRIASKLPQYLVRGSADLERYFSEQLRRLKTDHIDYYLMHMLTDVETGTSWKQPVCGDGWRKNSAWARSGQGGIFLHAILPCS